MESYQMNRAGCRPYNNTCGMNNACMPERRVCPSMRNNMEGPCDCGCQMRDSMGCQRDTGEKNGACPCEPAMYKHLEHLPVAMAYVPKQYFSTAYNLNYALNVGTIFPELCKPFCGRRGVCR